MKPPRMEVNETGIPAELKTDRAWVLWRWENRKGKWTKPPFQTSGKQAKSNDPATWTDYETAMSAYRTGGGWDGIGYQLDGSGYTGIDWDNCIDSDGNTPIEIIEQIEGINSYTEKSPSGTGFKTLVRGKLPDKGHHKEDDKEKNLEIGVFDSGRYFCITGRRIHDVSGNIEERQDQLNEFVKSHWPKDFEPKQDPQAEKQPQRPIDLSDSELIEKSLSANDGGKFRRLWNGDFSEYPSRSEADQALCCKLAFWTGNDAGRIDSLFRASGLMRDKWERENYRLKTIGKAIDKTSEIYEQRHRPETRTVGAAEWTAKESEQATGSAQQPDPGRPADEPCEEPQTRPKPDPLEFPLELMNGLAGDFAALYSEHLEPPPQFFFMAFLTCLGWAVSNQLSLNSEIKTPARLFTLLLGESADDRKSTAIDKTVDFFSETLEGFAVCRGVGSAEGLQKLFQEKPHLLLCFDEFKQFVSKCRVDGSVLLPLVNSLFESQRFETHTKTVKICVQNAGLSLLAASTTDTYQQTWSQAFTDIGFNNRLFLVVGKGGRKFAFPKPIPEMDKFLIRNRLREALRFVGTGRQLSITPDAEARFQDWYLSRETSVHSKRLDGYGLRLMQLLAVNDLKESIDLETVARVVSLCDWQLTARKLNDPIGADNVVAKLENNIRRQLEVRGIMSEAALRKWVHSDTHGLYYFNCALVNLEKAGIVERIRRGQKNFFRLLSGEEEAA
jgi:hypothetical protein